MTIQSAQSADKRKIVMDTILPGDVEDALKAAVATGERSKYAGLVQALEMAVQAGRLQPGQRLPPVRDLAWRLGVTPGTVARAYTRLTESGRLTAGVGRGTFVAGPSVQPVAPAVIPAPADALPAPDLSDQWPEMANLQVPRIPEMGQAALIRAAMIRLAGTATMEQLIGYPSPEREARSRAVVANWLDGAQVGAFVPSEVVLTHGGQAAIVAVLQAVLQGSDPVILTDEVTYAGFRAAAALCRARILGVPWDAEGPLPDALDRLARDHAAQVFCTSSEVCNPTTRATSPARRAEIAVVAQRRGLHVLDDDCYRLGPSLGPSYRALLPGLGWYVTSPSKNLTAALRIGAALAPEGWQPALERAVQGASFGVGLPVSMLLAEVLSDPARPAVTEAVRQRVMMLVRGAVNRLGAHPVGWREDVPFLWLDLPPGWRVASFLRAAEAAGVALRGSDDFTLREGRAVHSVRLGVNGRIAPGRFDAAVAQIARLLDAPPGSIGV